MITHFEPELLSKHLRIKVNKSTGIIMLFVMGVKVGFFSEKGIQVEGIWEQESAEEKWRSWENEIIRHFVIIYTLP